MPFDKITSAIFPFHDITFLGHSMAVGFTISKFVVIHSLESHEAYTEETLVDHLKYLVDEQALSLDVVLVHCSSATEFRETLAGLTHESASNDDRPLLHIECHGSEIDGLVFENSSTLGWEEYGELLTKLNIATKFNLLVAVSACYGSYLNGQSPVRPSPAFCIVAPTAEIDPGELMCGFRTFYTRLLETGDAGLAARALSLLRLMVDNGFRSWRNIGLSS